MFQIDSDISMYVNSFAGRSWAIDEIVNFIAGSELVKGGLVLAILYYLWFQAKSKDPASAASEKENREILLYILIMILPGILLIRGMSLLFPFRTRPVFVESLHLRLASGLSQRIFVNWSSFPSDHAFLFFALATGIYFVHRKLGLLLAIHAILIICLPRLYLGLHYTSDLAVGGLLGVGVAYTVKLPKWRAIVVRPAWRLKELSPGLFYAGMFFFADETAELYDSAHALGSGMLKVAHLVWHALHH